MNELSRDSGQVSSHDETGCAAAINVSARQRHASNSPLTLYDQAPTGYADRVRSALGEEGIGY